MPSEHTTNSATERMKRFLEDKDWKFYCAVAAGVAAAGAGAYYLSSSGSDKKKPKQHKREMKKEGSASSPAAAETKKEKEPATAEKAAAVSEEQYEDMSDEAIEALSQEKRAEAAQTLKAKGNSLFTSKNYEEAVRLYTQAIRFKADSIFFANRAACFANLGKHDNVIEDCNAALKLDPVYVKALNRRALAFEKKGEFVNSLYDYTCVCILDGFRNENAAKAMERMLQRVSQDKAQEIMKSKKPRLPSSTFVNAYFESFRPVNLELPANVDESSGDGYFVKAYNAVKEKNFTEALEACEKAIELGCSSQYQAYAYNLRGTFDFLKGDNKGALEALDKSIELDSKLVQSYIKRSSLYMEQSDITNAFKQFDDALAINPSDPDVYYHRGQVNYISGNFDAAAKDYTESLKLDDSFVFAHIQLGVVQYKLGSISSAMSTFNNTLKKFPQSADVQNYYGELLVDQQKISEAIEAFSKAIELDAKNPLPYINKAMLMYQAMGDATEATNLCKKALEFDPACDAAVASLAQILLELGKAEEALGYYEMAIGLARTQPELEHAISYVEATKAQIRFAQEYPEAAAKLRAGRGGM
ncbi:tpr domain containing protein [Lichtheimia corymbifera JMRC:FSU:9682]|uniref:Tpr domain containing protein n=1 Tax=Lichtheimia corymbifera JMRC:FSU:9682 TaxID=1263082 RepID=A0A068RYR6_9FUNG|nr:tpr domain containing protein [Lichtheimia corymbifera JMRC:FSU:9682]